MIKTTRRLIGVENTAQYRLRNSYTFKGNQHNYNIVGFKDYGTLSNVWTQLSYNFGGNSNYHGCCLMRDGRVFVNPYNASSALIYDPILNTFTSVGSGITGYLSSCLLFDGRIFLSPFSTSIARIYDPVNNSFFSTGSLTNSLCCLLQDGRVLNYPSTGGIGQVYNPTANTFSTTNNSLPNVSNGYIGSILMQDGNVIILPFGANSIFIYKVNDNAFVNVATSGGNVFGCLMADGNIFLSSLNVIPIANSSVFKIFNPNNNAITSLASYTGYGQCCLLPNNNILILPDRNSVTSALIYSPINNSFTTTGSFGNTDFKFRGMTLLPDGRVFCVPHNLSNAWIYGLPLTNKLPMARTHSSHYNKL